MRIKKINLKPPKIEKMHITHAGERTLTAAQKRKLKEEVGYRCQICKKKYNPRFLEIHHKKGIAKHKSQLGATLPIFSIGKKYKPKYERKSNLQVVCITCHDKTKKKKKIKKKKDILGFSFKDLLRV